MVIVVFLEGNPAKGFIAWGGEVGVDGTKPQDVTLDAVGDIDLGDAVAAALRENDTIVITGPVVPGPSGSVTGQVAFSGPSILIHSRVSV